MFKQDNINGSNDLYENLQFEDEAQTNLASYRSNMEGKDQDKQAYGKGVKTGKNKKIAKLDLPMQT